jgi:hypothetical protein
MRKGSITVMAAAGIFGASLVVGAGMPLAETDKPKYGGTLEIGTVYVTLSALSFDPADWNWKLNHDTGNYLEQLCGRSHQERQERWQAPLLCRRLPARGCHPWRAAGELGVEGRSAPRRDEGAQGRHVPG